VPWALGVAADADYTQARTATSVSNLVSTRVRLEGLVLPLQVPVGQATFRFGLVAGVGALIDVHSLGTSAVDTVVKPAYGLTARLCPQASLDVGVGEFVVGLPFEGSTEFAQPGLPAYAPLAAGVLAGYRLGL
jgi:hypothetical protein